jgi:parallel beta-helix repeat protein
MLLFVLLICVLNAVPAYARKAFPSAEGYGADTTTGGSGGVVIVVNNLNDSGTGSLRACMEGTGARTCVFRVGGMINLTSAINVAEPNSNLTVAGQTAPGEGVTVGPWPIIIAYGANNVIIRHLRHRQAFEEWPGNPTFPPNANNDCGGFFLYGPSGFHTHHIILDHVSVGYTCDDSLQMSGYVTDSTIQWSVVADPYEQAKGDPYGASKGFIFGGNDPATAPLTTGTMHHNMFLNTGTRNPGGGPQSVMDWRYNIVYNWFACTGGLRLGGTDENQPGSLQSNHNFVGNRYIDGPETNTSGCWLGELRTEGNSKVYVQDNVTPFCGMDSCASNEWNLGWGNGTTGGHPAESSVFQVFTPFSAPALTSTPRNTMESMLTAKAGAIVPQRDALDSRVINEMQTRTGNTGRLGAPFPSLPTVTSFPPDADDDGMPDAWETSHGLNPNNAADRNTVAANGYTNLENYLNELAGDDTGGVTPPPFTPNINPIYVSAGGHGDTPTDAGDCGVPENITTPRATLAAALACMQFPGKVLYIRGGTYAGIINTNIGPILGGNTPSAPTRIEGYQSETAIIEMPLGEVNAVEVNSISNLSISKLIVDAKNRAESNALTCISSTNITVSTIEFKNSFYEVGYFNGCNNVTVSSTTFHDTTNGSVIILVGTSTSVTFHQVTVYNGPLQGIEAHNGSHNNGLTIARTTVRNTGSGAGGAAIDIGGDSGALLVNNLVYSNNVGIRIRGTASNAKLYNNTVAVNTGAGVQCDSGASSIEIANTISFGNTPNLVNNCGVVPLTSLTGLTNPLFVNPPTDLRLSDGSIGIDTGTNIPTITLDVAGLPRQQGQQDIGAHERTQTPTTGGDVTVQPRADREASLFF